MHHYKITTKTFDEWEVHEVYFGGIQATEESMTRMIDELYALVKKQNTAFGLIYDVADYVPTPGAKQYAKKLSILVQNNDLHLLTVVINASVFEQQVFSVIRSDIQFAKTLQEAYEKIALAVKGNE